MGRYINAEELKHLLNKSCYYDTPEGFAFSDMIYECKTADVQEVKHGKWIRTGWQKGDYGKPNTEIEYKCSECKRNKIYKRETQKLPNYCGSCGAKMDQEEEQ